MLGRAFIALCALLLTTVPALAFQPPAEPMEGFVRLDQLPPTEQLPAAPFLITAYAFALLAVTFYIWTLWRRLRAVEHDIQALARRRTTPTAGSAPR